MNRTQLNRINSNSSDLQNMNRTQLNRINSNVKVLKIDYSTASVKEIARKQKQLMRTREGKMNNTKKMCTKKLCKNFVKILMVLKSTSKKELKSFAAKTNYQWKR